MNRSPDNTNGRPAEAELEERLRAADAAPSDPELAADWALRQELRALADADAPGGGLPASLRRAVLDHAGEHPSRRGARWPGLPVAMAASLAALVALAVVLRTGDEPATAPATTPSVAATNQASGPATATVDEAAAEDLKLALATLDRTSRHAISVAGREVGEQLAEDLPRIEIERLPYGRLLTSFRLAPPRSYHPEEN